MKKVFFMFMTLLFGMLVSCGGGKSSQEVLSSMDKFMKKNKPAETTAVIGPKVTIENFNTLLNNDYGYVKSLDSTAIYYETDIVFTDAVSADSFEIDSCINVVQSHRTCYLFKHGGVLADSVFKVNDYWMECCQIDPSKVITLDVAIQQLMKANLPKPNSKLCVLRWILGPNSLKENPGYYFGDNHHAPWVKVDAYTGEVTIVD